MKAGIIPEEKDLPGQVDFDIVISDRKALLYAQNHSKKDELPNDKSQSSNSSSSSESSESSSDSESDEVENSAEQGSDVEMVSADAECGEDEQSEMASVEEEQEECIAVNRQRREIKSYQMEDHIYYIKASTDHQQKPTVSKSQLKAKRQAKQAAKDFQK